MDHSGSSLFLAFYKRGENRRKKLLKVIKVSPKIATAWKNKNRS